jgi:LysR family transcriptional regulator for bpeEF and oprC
VLEDWTSTPLPVNIVYPQNRHLSAKVRVFVEWMADLFTKHPRLQLQVKRD